MMTPSEAVDSLIGLLEPKYDDRIRFEAAVELLNRARSLDEQE